MNNLSPTYMRMKQAVQWLKREKQMLQKDIAAKMGISEVAFSNAMKRIQVKFDEDFIIAFQQSTDDVFSLDYLLTGEGELLARPKAKVHDKPTESIIELYATLIKEVEGMRQQLARELSEVHTIRAELRQSIADLQAATLEVQRTRDLLLSTPHNEALPSPTCNKPSGDTHHLSIAADELSEPETT